MCLNRNRRPVERSGFSSKKLRIPICFGVLFFVKMRLRQSRLMTMLEKNSLPVSLICYSFLFYRRAEFAWRFLLEVIIEDFVLIAFINLRKENA